MPQKVLLPQLWKELRSVLVLFSKTGSVKANWYPLRQIVTKVNQISAVKVNYRLACAPLYEGRGRLYTGYHWSELISNLKFTTFHSAVLLPIWGLSRVRLLGRCCVALHSGNVLGAPTLMLLASSKIRGNRPPLKTVPWCNSILHRPSLQGNFK